MTEIPTEVLEAAAEAIRQRLDDLGTEGHDMEGTPDGSLWLDGLDSVAEDLARTVGPYLIAEGRRQALTYAPNDGAVLTHEQAADLPRLMARYERELRAKIAAEIRAEAQREIDTQGSWFWFVHGETGLKSGAEWAARIAEGADHG